MTDFTKRLPLLTSALQSLEDKIYAHALLGQLATVASFLDVVLRKANLENFVSLTCNWTEETLKNKYINIIISAQNEIPNIKHVEECFTVLCNTKFKYCRFIKYIGAISMPDLSKLKMTIADDDKSNNITINAADLRFLVAKAGADEYGRSIKIIVYLDEYADHLLKPTEEQDHWIPDPHLFYMMDLIFNEYYMTRYISSISFVPKIIMPANSPLLTVNQIRDDIDILLNLKHKLCAKCNLPDYRVQLTNDCCNVCK